jgi:type IV pilus assembly protein PilB
MGLEPFNVAAALNVLTAQRLLRRVCVKCKTETSYTDEYLDAANMPPEYRHLQYYKGAGCETCNGSGYKGRAGVYEVLPMTTEMRRAVMRGASSDELRELAISEGMLTLRMDGLLKASRGTTTLEEVIKETAAV